MEWISVKENVPPPFVDVLVYSQSHGECRVSYRLDEYHANALDVHDHYAWSEQGLTNEIHYWMPLPAPPEGSIFIELGTSTGVSFMTSEGIKRLKPGVSYDENLDEMEQKEGGSGGMG